MNFARLRTHSFSRSSLHFPFYVQHNLLLLSLIFDFLILDLSSLEFTLNCRSFLSLQDIFLSKTAKIFLSTLKGKGELALLVELIYPEKNSNQNKKYFSHIILYSPLN